MPLRTRRNPVPRTDLALALLRSEPERHAGGSGWAAVMRSANGPVRIVATAIAREDLPPDATSATIPGAFLEPGTKTGGELLARERSGNQTITAFPAFRTK
jgi:hypothetical protein